jgi:hypothetical protein
VQKAADASNHQSKLAVADDAFLNVLVVIDAPQQQMNATL